MITPFNFSRKILRKKVIQPILITFLIISFIFILTTDIYSLNYNFFIVQCFIILVSVINLFFATLFTKNFLKNFEDKHFIIKYITVWAPFLFSIQWFINCIHSLVLSIRYLNFAAFLSFTLILPMLLACCKISLILEKQILYINDEKLAQEHLEYVGLNLTYTNMLKFCKWIYANNIHIKVILFYLLFLFPITIMLSYPISSEQLRLMIEGTIFMTLFGYFVPRIIAKPEPLIKPKYNEISPIKQHYKNLMLFLFPLAITFANVITLIDFISSRNICDTMFMFPNIVMILSLFRSIIILDDYKNDLL